MHQRTALISGASFAGLSTAFWLLSAGFAVTIVEVAPGFRKGGTPVDIKGRTFVTVKRMGLSDLIAANRIETHSLELWGPDGRIMPDPSLAPGGSYIADDSGPEECEIERDVLTALLFDLVKDRIELVFDDSISRLEERADCIDVSFRRGDKRSFDFVFGCDGLHSNVRKLWFGEEASYARFLGAYGSVAIVPRLLIGEGTTALYQVPGKMVVLSGYNGKTDIIALFTTNRLIDYDRRDQKQQIALIVEHLAGEGWRVPELIGEIEHSDYLWVSDLSQIRMPSWSKGRVCLVGDAAFCASPAAGMGGSLAIDGAAALGDAFAEYPDDYSMAFQAYEASFRPIVKTVQANASAFCKSITKGRSFS